MPTLRIQTNVRVPAEQRETLLGHASDTVARMLGKPESYVMVILEDDCHMFFGASAQPAAFVELKSLGLTETRTVEYSGTLCSFLEETLQVPSERVYIEFASPPRHLFGWNKATF